MKEISVLARFIKPLTKMMHKGMNKILKMRSIQKRTITKVKAIPK